MYFCGMCDPGKVPSGNVESLEGWLLRLDDIAFWGECGSMCVLISIFYPSSALRVQHVCGCEDQSEWTPHRVPV